MSTSFAITECEFEEGKKDRRVVLEGSRLLLVFSEKGVDVDARELCREPAAEFALVMKHLKAIDGVILQLCGENYEMARPKF